MERTPTNYPHMSTSRFEPTDVELLEKVMSLDPDLAVVAEIVKHARGTLTYPVNSHEALEGFFANEGSERRFGGRMITIEEARRFVPDSFFPVDCEEDLIQKAYLALKNGHRSHESAEIRRAYHAAALHEQEEGSLLMRRPIASARDFTVGKGE